MPTNAFVRRRIDSLQVVQPLKGEQYLSVHAGRVEELQQEQQVVPPFK